MTAQARITQADFDRAAKAAANSAKKTGVPARTIFRLIPREIEIIFGDNGRETQTDFDPEGWHDADA
ncbi:hypothetical protein NS277_16460 [Novosphingobium barchaimii]|nr:hypothetical protein NS277_16460 [Novosphingobium barchaimii]